jgi:hypothetical protein
MATITATQRNALLRAVDAVLDTIREMGRDGAPAGPLYLALMGMGCTLGQFEMLMDALVRTGKVRKQGDVYYAVEG